jgi:N-acetylmuramoyl-L-alanine amidase
MFGRIVLCALAWCVAASPASAADAAREPYLAAVAHEEAVRNAVALEEVPAAGMTELHTVVTEYRAIVRRFPASAYSDDALWRAGRLSLEAFERFGQANDRNLGVRLLKALTASYPTSRFVKLVPEQLARFDGGESGMTASASGSLNPPHEGSGFQSVATSSTDGPHAPPFEGPQIPRISAARETGPDPLVVSGRKMATIRAIRRTVLADAIRITIELDAEVPFHEESIANPTRVFLDLPGTRAVPALLDRTIRFEGDGDLVRQVRIGRHPNNTTRVVLDADGISRFSVYPMYEPYRLVIDCVRATSATATTLASRRIALDWSRELPRTTARAEATIAEATTRPAADPPPLPAAADRNMNGGFSIARQLGLGVSRIVIDPGHGGHDPGAQGKGIAEAELVLDVALRLEKLLQKTIGTEVVLTRRSDTFVPLQERTAIANREGADLFLSIHANASAVPQARGVETYFLNFANNLGAAAVAARENAASGQVMADLPDFVKAIALNNKLDESRDFASAVQRAMVERLRGTNKSLKDLGVRQAPFLVLIGAAMPSVLAEISFVTNTQEAKLLKGGPYRQRIAEALFNAIQNYQTSLRSVTKVAHQN